MTDALDEFLAGHFNQDWNLIFGEAEEAVRRFMLHGPEVVGHARADVLDLLDAHPDDAALDAEVERRGCHFYSDAPGGVRRMLLSAVQTWDGYLNTEPPGMEVSGQ